MSAFDDALALVLKMEGGRVNDPRDPGGRTNQGITQATYNAWRATQDLPRRDVYLITQAEVAAIYRDDYADRVRFDDLPPGVGYAVFDEAVNSGPIAAAKQLQRVIGVTSDGVIGVMTLAKARGIKDRAALVNRLCDGRLTVLRRLRAWLTFGNGWSSRVAAVRRHALAMATAPANRAAQ